MCAVRVRGEGDVPRARGIVEARAVVGGEEGDDVGLVTLGAKETDGGFV